MVSSPLWPACKRAWEQREIAFGVPWCEAKRCGISIRFLQASNDLFCCRKPEHGFPKQNTILCLIASMKIRVIWNSVQLLIGFKEPWNKNRQCHMPRVPRVLGRWFASCSTASFSTLLWFWSLPEPRKAFCLNHSWHLVDLELAPYKTESLKRLQIIITPCDVSLQKSARTTTWQLSPQNTSLQMSTPGHFPSQILQTHLGIWAISPLQLLVFLRAECHRAHFQSDMK